MNRIIIDNTQPNYWKSNISLSIFFAIDNIFHYSIMKQMERPIAYRYWRGGGLGLGSEAVKQWKTRVENKQPVKISEVVRPPIRSLTWEIRAQLQQIDVCWPVHAYVLWGRALALHIHRTRQYYSLSEWSSERNHHSIRGTNGVHALCRAGLHKFGYGI